MQTSLPRLVPGTVVVRPGDGTVQIGLDDQAVRVHDLGEPLLRFLSLLDRPSGTTPPGAHTWLPEPTVEDLVGVLGEAGLLDSPPPPGVVSIVGAGPLGEAIGRLLCRDEVALLAVSVPGAEDEEQTAPDLAARLRPEAGPATRVIAVDHWSKPDDASPDVTVIAADGPECDRAIPEALARDGHAYLPVRLVGRGVRVGPFVVPGQGPCLRCCDLARRARNPAWPVVLHQLTRVHGEADPSALAWGAATAAAQVLAHLAGRRPETWAATLELGPPDWVARLRRWSVHPECGCAGRVRTRPRSA